MREEDVETDALLFWFWSINGSQCKICREAASIRLFEGRTNAMAADGNM